jgi:hypothetical protein
MGIVTTVVLFRLFMSFFNLVKVQFINPLFSYQKWETIMSFFHTISALQHSKTPRLKDAVLSNKDNYSDNPGICFGISLYHH